jgi:predicted RNase H-like nuclease (RuvC/YqgF family)
MEQYEKSGPGPEPEKQYTRSEIDQQIKDLREFCDSQRREIENLKVELRRIKTKMDAHASTINQLKRNG